MQKHLLSIVASIAFSLAITGDVCAKKSSSPKKSSNPVIVKVGSKVVKLNDLKKIQEEDPQMKNAPFEMIFTMLRSGLLAEMLIDRAVEGEKSLTTNPEVKKLAQKCLSHAKREIYMKNKIKGLIKPKEVREEYNKFAKEYKKQNSLDLKHILVPNKEQAVKVIGKLKKGNDFDSLAKEYSTDPNSKEGKSLGFLTKAELPPSFAEVAYKLKKGEVADTPVKSEFGWHIIMLKDKKPAIPPAYDTVKGEIEGAIAQARAQQILQGLMKEGNVKVFEIDGSPAALKSPK